LGVARCGLSLTPPVMCGHVRGWHQAAPMFSNYDNRFAQDIGLLFCLANTRIRHEVNQAASAKAHSSGRAFEQSKEAINDEDFEDLLKDAHADPKGVAAQDLLKKVLPFNISSRQLF